MSGSTAASLMQGEAAAVTPGAPGTMEYLVVGGGGSGGANAIYPSGAAVGQYAQAGVGGGGAGGLLCGTLTGPTAVQNDVAYLIQVGVGGEGSCWPSQAPQIINCTNAGFACVAGGYACGNAGGDSYFLCRVGTGIIACGGGSGGGTMAMGNTRQFGTINIPGTTGGSGGGAGRGAPLVLNGTGIPGQGTNGAATGATLPQAGTGGGGAQQAGLQPSSPLQAGGGGAGIPQIAITGTICTYAGGGGGGAAYVPTINISGGPGGVGGGGTGGKIVIPITAQPWPAQQFAGSGTNGLGGGGGGGVGNQFYPSDIGVTGVSQGYGGSGVVIIAYPGTCTIPHISLGLTYTTTTAARPGYRVYCFTAGRGQIMWRTGSTPTIHCGEALVVAGGGGGGGASSQTIANVQTGGGGGGGGGLLYSGILLQPSRTYCVVVGAGGAGGTGCYCNNQSTITNGTSGGNSCFYDTSAAGTPNCNINLVACGGGGGGGASLPLFCTQGGAAVGLDGGSGGGGRGGAIRGRTIRPAQGYGGSAFGAGEGGGGAGWSGRMRTGPAPNQAGQCGGDGLAISITGTPVTYAGGGGGGGGKCACCFSPEPRSYLGGVGGTGGGGAGGCAAPQYLLPNINGTNGSPNLGGGGGGVGQLQFAPGAPTPTSLGCAPATATASAGSGGSGVVIIALCTPATFSTIAPTLTASTSPARPGYTVYCFTAGSGTVVTN